MRKAGSVVAEMHEVCTRAAKPGATTADLDAAAREVLDRRAAQSNFLNYHGFPAVACISPNEVIVHGIPGDRRARRRRHRVGRLRRDRRGLARRRRDHHPGRDDRRRVPAPHRGDPGRRSRPRSRSRRSGNRLGDIGAAVEGVARTAGFSVVREYVGHGIGTAMHEDPEVPNFGAGRGMRLRPRDGAGDRAHAERGQAPRPACSTTAGPS